MSLHQSYQERIVLDRFRASCKEFPAGKIMKTESPDFIIKTSPRKSIGIELISLPNRNYTIDPESLNSFNEVFRSSVDKKADKLPLYRKQWANAYWLVVYADSIKVQGVDLSESIGKIKDSASFQKICLFEMFGGTLWQFPLTGE